MKIDYKNYLSKIGFFLYDALGLQYIVEKINPPIDENGKRPARTVFLWLLGIYVSLFGIASSRYEQILSRLENRVNFTIGQIGAENGQLLTSEIPELQHTKIPIQPSFVNPFTVIGSFFNFFDRTDIQIIDELQNVLYRQKKDLAKVNLSNVILSNKMDLVKNDIVGKSFKVYEIKDRNFSDSNFKDAILHNADLKNINFYRSNFSNAVLSSADMSNCNLSYANLSYAILQNADLSHAKLAHTDMQNAVLEDTNLENAVLVGVNLTETHDLITAKLKGALYNSAATVLRSIPKDADIKHFCESNKLGDDCAGYVIGNISSVFERATKFPSDFNPANHGMIDVQTIIRKPNNK